MPGLPPPPEKAMLALLRGVSRSFFLSIRLLPQALRRPVALGYLLARASDTIADAPGLAADERLQALDGFLSAVHGQGDAPRITAAHGATRDEQLLLGALPDCIAWLDRLAAADRNDVCIVLAHIVRGQRLDIERFGAAHARQPAALATAAELEEYTYLVAGCVGEFWTKLGFRHLPGFASLSESEMLQLGRRYGMALQLINVLRDADRDLGAGRRYLPAGEPREPWLDRARAGLECGMRYVGALRSARVRVATALPALIGARTLALLRVHGAGAKMPRAEVRALLLRILFTLGSNASLQREFRKEFRDNRPR
jgi:farnesyl-diphosphate farnesyltransferase